MRRRLNSSVFCTSLVVQDFFLRLKLITGWLTPFATDYCEIRYEFFPFFTP